MASFQDIRWGTKSVSLWILKHVEAQPAVVGVLMHQDLLECCNSRSNDDSNSNSDIYVAFFLAIEAR